MAFVNEEYDLPMLLKLLVGSSPADTLQQLPVPGAMAVGPSEGGLASLFQRILQKLGRGGAAETSYMGALKPAGGGGAAALTDEATQQLYRQPPVPSRGYGGLTGQELASGHPTYPMEPPPGPLDNETLDAMIEWLIENAQRTQ